MGVSAARPVKELELVRQDEVACAADPDVPSIQSTEIELVADIKTAKSLGLTIPPPLLARVDGVIE
jgi:hypothetical protein